MGDFEDALANAAATTALHFRYGDGVALDGRVGQLVNLRELQLRDVPADCVLPQELLALPLVELGLSGANDKLVVPALVPQLPITRLTVWDLHASELPPLPRLERLEIVVQDPQSEVAVLAERFAHLRELRIWGSQLEHGSLPDEIERFRQLEVLELISCGVRTLPDVLAKLDTLRRFEIRGCPMDQFPEVLTRMSKLEVVQIGEPIAGLPPTLGNMRSLRELGLGHALNKGAMLSRSDDIATMKALPEVLGELANLERLDIDCCGVFDIAPLRTLTKLKKLSMAWSAVRTVEPLGELTELEELSIEHADRVRDLSPLAACKKLVTLNISNTKPRSLDFLRALPALKQLNAEGIESKKIGAIYDLEVALEADDEIKRQYAARAQLRAMPSIDSIVVQLAVRDLASVETACQHLATWAAASSTRDENALLALGIPAHDEDEDDEGDDEDEDDDDEDDDDDEGDDDEGAIRAGGALPALDAALDRYLAQLSGATLARLFGVLFHDVNDHFPAALRIANELVSRGDDDAQCLLADAFIAASESSDARHREHGYTVHDLLIDEVMPLLGGPALAKLLAWAPADALDLDHGDGMGVLFAPAIARARGGDFAQVMAALEKYASSRTDFTGGTNKIEALWATFPRGTHADAALDELRGRIDAHR
jgi:Leucine-rich repeat (LRR) protein